MKTEYRDLSAIGFPRYAVNIEGNVIHTSIAGKQNILKPCNKGGYNFYHLYDATTKCNKNINKGRLILTAFCPLSNMDELEVDHIDRNPLNDNINNLRWVTHSMNILNRKFSGKTRKMHKQGIYIIDLDNNINYYRHLKDCPYSPPTIASVAARDDHYSQKHKIYMYYKEDFDKLMNNLLSKQKSIKNIAKNVKKA